jgi:hypothetical protein
MAEAIIAHGIIEYQSPSVGIGCDDCGGIGGLDPGRGRSQSISVYLAHMGVIYSCSTNNTDTKKYNQEEYYTYAYE